MVLVSCIVLIDVISCNLSCYVCFCFAGMYWILEPLLLSLCPCLRCWIYFYSSFCFFPSGVLMLCFYQEMVNSPRLASRSRAFDLILNLGVHGHLLEPIILDDAATVEEETFLDNEVIFSPQGKRESDFTKKMGNSSAINNFETWILSILYEILLHLVQVHLIRDSFMTKHEKSKCTTLFRKHH